MLNRIDYREILVCIETRINWITDHVIPALSSSEDDLLALEYKGEIIRLQELKEKISEEMNNY